MILAPSLGENGEDRGEYVGSRGTGIAIRNDLILTSRHVVRPERRDGRYPIKILWYALAPDNEYSDEDWVDLEADESSIVWDGVRDGGSNLDAVLLKCPRQAHKSIKNLPYPELPTSSPDAGSAWRSRGFPVAAREEGVWKHDDFIGRVLATPTRNDPYLSLSSELGTDTERDWAGASGMPVLIGNAMYGVIKAVPLKHGTQKFQAVPTTRLLQQPAFRELLGLDKKTPIHHLSALIGKEETLEAIRKRSLVGRKPHAFVLDGDEREWPLALLDRLSHKLSPHDFSSKEVWPLFPEMAGSGEEVLLSLGIENEWHLSDSSTLNDLVERLEAIRGPRVYGVRINPKSEPCAKVLIETIRVWEGLSSPKLRYPVYLLFVREYAPTVPSGLDRLKKLFLCNVHRGQWGEASRAFRKAKQDDKWLPPLTSPDANDVLIIWLQGIFKSHIESNKGLNVVPDQLIQFESGVRTLYYDDSDQPTQRPALPHKKLREKLVEIWNQTLRTCSRSYC